MEKEYDEKHKSTLSKDVSKAKKDYEDALSDSKKASISLLQRHHFASRLQRMSTVC